MMKERFTDEQWRTLERLPVLVFIQVALADGNLEDEESTTFVAEMLDAPNWRDPLIRELLLTLAEADHFTSAFEAATRLSTTSAEAVLAELGAGKTILRDNLTEEEYQRFAFSLIGLARKISDAHTERTKKKGLFHRKKEEASATSDVEAQMIGLLSAIFGLDPGAALKGFDDLAGGDGKPPMV